MELLWVAEFYISAVLLHVAGGGAQTSDIKSIIYWMYWSDPITGFFTQQ